MAMQWYWSWKKKDVPTRPKAPKFEEKLKFYDGGEKFGFVSEKRKNPASLQILSHIQKRHVFSRSYHLQNCSVILILDIITMSRGGRYEVEF